MPIPLMTPPQEEPVPITRPSFHLVPKQETDGKWVSLAPRAVAHFIDLLVVLGFSLYAAKMFSLFLVALHMPEIRESGRMAGRLFRDTLTYSQGKLAIATFVFLAVAYFIALPRFSGRTLGMGLLGLKLETNEGGHPGLKALAVRFAGCVMIYATGGMMLTHILKRTPKPLFHDRISGTTVVKAG